MTSKEELLAKLTPWGQEHLVAFWDELNVPERTRLADQITSIDFGALQRFVSGTDGSPDWKELSNRARPPRAIRQNGVNEFSFATAVERGEEALRAGKVGMILVAGGQGTRLGFQLPKGMFPLGPLSNRTLFQILVDRLHAVRKRYAVSIPLFLMTSPATHEETLAYLRHENHLGLPPEDVVCFCQGTFPAVERSTGKVLLESRHSVALSPDGHGGLLSAMQRSTCFGNLQKRGIELIFYGQVDNPLLQVCDPALLGYHLLAGAEMTTQVVEKRDPLERVGNVVEIDGQTQIIEYSDLPDEAAQRRTPDGKLLLWAGNIAVHVFNVDFLVQYAAEANSQPIHRAHKKVPFVNASGQSVDPTSPNAIKFERFIFDLLPKARNALVVEVDPADAFAPVKNASGAATDSPESARAAMIERDRKLLEAAGAVCTPDVAIEVHPLWAYEVQEAARKLPRGFRVVEPTYFGPAQ